MKFAPAVVTAIFSIFLLNACGPEKSELDLERERTKEQLIQKNSETEPLVGEYKGWAMHDGVKVFQLNLFIERTYKSVTTGGSEPVMVPKLVVAGYFDSKTSSTADFIFPDVDYFAANKMLVCSTQSGSPSGSTTDAGPASLILDFSGGNPTGTYTPPRIIVLQNGKKVLSLNVVLEKIN